MKAKLIGFLVVVAIVVAALATHHKSTEDKYDNELFFGSLDSSSGYVSRLV